MKHLLTLTVFCLVAQFADGQACGIYRIEYVGNLETTNKEIVAVHLPTTLFLHGAEPEKSEPAFIDATLTNGLFKSAIQSHLTTPYNTINQLLSFYKNQSDRFIMKVSYSENSSLQETIVEIDWDKIEVALIEDGMMGTLFRFTLKDIVF